MIIRLVLFSLFCLPSLSLGDAAFIDEAYQSAAVASGPGTVSHGSTGATATASASTLTLTKPSGTSSGDYLIADISTDSVTTVTLTGWTVLYTTDMGAGSGTLVTLYKEAGGSEPASYSFGLGTSAVCGGMITRYTKDSGTWTIESQDDMILVQDTDLTIPDGTITASQAGAMVHVAYGSDDYVSGSCELTTEPSGMTQNGNTSYSSGEIYTWREAVGSGAWSDTISITCSSLQGSLHAVILEAQ